ncbi:DUF202 domain-containing protein [uncultured Amnibacterium sp.]|uniref:DUF202 domain-containing protein n=1 Tax=uncultured Amnibacterium sp. TaxID=1631851 RepID=UPI0035CC8422
MTSPGRDPGLQRERTELAWRRTLLAFAIGALISMRVLSGTFGGWAVLVGVGGLMITAALWALVHGSSRGSASPGSTHGPPSFGPSRLLMGTVALASMLGAALGLVELVTSASR